MADFLRHVAPAIPARAYFSKNLSRLCVARATLLFSFSRFLPH